ncbi:MAG: hypothetical protein FJ194_09825 [Gammaproteobacteria bacterium]|nr:hypothetical protein [Gammaproteobacteria bacterium]
MQLERPQGWREAPASGKLVAIIATVILCAGFVLHASFAQPDLAIPVLLVALAVSNLATRRGLTLMVGIVASVMLVMAHLGTLLSVLGNAPQSSVPVSLLAGLGAIWITTSILLWDPRRKALTLDTFAQAFDNAPTCRLLVSETDEIVSINSTLLKQLSLDGQDVVGNPVASLGGGVISDALKRGRTELGQGKS